MPPHEVDPNVHPTKSDVRLRHGDRVLARIARRRNDGRAEGRVVQIVVREHPTLVGLFRYGTHGNVVLPYDTRIHHEVVIPPGDELSPDLREKLRAKYIAPDPDIE